MPLKIEDIAVSGYERVVRGQDPKAGLDAIVSVHDTTLGPSLGGVRMLPYPTWDDALNDANRLAKAMTYKAAVARTGQGGGKAVIIGEPGTMKSEALFLALGDLIEALGGDYYAAEDMNISVTDLEIVARRTKWVTGLSRERGFSGNPSPITALGCLIGMKASAKEALGTECLEGMTIAIQGVGAVGSALAELCKGEGATLAVCDIDTEKVARFAEDRGMCVLEGPDACLDYSCDILSPCARGGVLNRDTIPELRCKIVAGAANNQLQEPEDSDRLQGGGILYAPDYVINAGGILNIACEFDEGGYTEEAARTRVKTIATSLEEVYGIAREEGISTAVAADRLAEERLRVGRVQ